MSFSVWTFSSSCFFSPHSALLKKLIRLLLSPPPFSEQLFTLGALIRAKMLC